MNRFRWVWRNDGDLIIQGVMARFRWNSSLKRKIGALGAILNVVQMPFLGKSA